MVNRPFLAYVIARSAAHDMDRRGPPGAFLRGVVLIPLAIVVLGFAGLFLAFGVSFGAWELGIG